MESLGVSVITTVFNEGESIDAFLDSLASQTRPADEIVIVVSCTGGETVASSVSVTSLPLGPVPKAVASLSNGETPLRFATMHS